MRTLEPRCLEPACEHPHTPRIPIPLTHTPSRNLNGQLVNNVCLRCVFHRYKITDKRRLRGEGFALAQGVSKQSSHLMGITAGARGARLQMVTLYPQAACRGMDVGAQLFSPSFFSPRLQPRDALPTFRVDLPDSVTSFWKHPQGHIQRYVFKRILNQDN